MISRSRFGNQAPLHASQLTHQPLARITRTQSKHRASKHRAPNSKRTALAEGASDALNVSQGTSNAPLNKKHYIGNQDRFKQNQNIRNLPVQAGSSLNKILNTVGNEVLGNARYPLSGSVFETPNEMAAVIRDDCFDEGRNSRSSSIDSVIFINLEDANMTRFEPLVSSENLDGTHVNFNYSSDIYHYQRKPIIPQHENLSQSKSQTCHQYKVLQHKPITQLAWEKTGIKFELEESSENLDGMRVNFNYSSDIYHYQRKPIIPQHKNLSQSKSQTCHQYEVLQHHPREKTEIKFELKESTENLDGIHVDFNYSLNINQPELNIPQHENPSRSSSQTYHQSKVSEHHPTTHIQPAWEKPKMEVKRERSDGISEERGVVCSPSKEKTECASMSNQPSDIMKWPPSRKVIFKNLPSSNRQNIVRKILKKSGFWKKNIKIENVKGEKNGYKPYSFVRFENRTQCRDFFIYCNKGDNPLGEIKVEYSNEDRERRARRRLIWPGRKVSL